MPPIAADRATLMAHAPRLAVTRQQIAAIHNTHRVVIVGLAAVIVSGVLLFAADVNTYAVSKLFWLKMGMVALLMVNGAILVRVGRNVPEPDERHAPHDALDGRPQPGALVPDDARRSRAAEYLDRAMKEI